MSCKEPMHIRGKVKRHFKIWKDDFEHEGESYIDPVRFMGIAEEKMFHIDKWKNVDILFSRCKETEENNIQVVTVEAKVTQTFDVDCGFLSDEEMVKEAKCRFAKQNGLDSDNIDELEEKPV